MIIKSNRNRSLLLFAFLCACFVLPQVEAARVTSEQASVAARNWLRKGYGFERRMGNGIASVRTLDGTNGSAFYIAAVEGGGFVVLSSDTENAPVVAVSAGGTGEPDERNPLWALLRQDMEARMRANAAGRIAHKAIKNSNAAGLSSEARWAELLEENEPQFDPPSGRGKSLSESNGRTSIADVRVDALVKSSWAQEDYRNFGYTSDDDVCYNYYTPNHWPCGCVATAGAQLMRYHLYPSSQVSSGTYLCNIGGVKTYLEMYGGNYDWNAMALVPADGCSETCRRAIGRLTYDIGVSVGMGYNAVGSSSPSYMLAKRLVDRFRYANAACVVFKDNFYSDGEYSYTLDRLKSAVIPNLDAGLPVVLDVSGGAGGHAVIGDGYGYSGGDFFIHINLGWANNDGGNAWYMPPNIDEYTAIGSIVYNIYPSGPSGASFVSGRVFSADRTPVEGATVRVYANGREMASTTSGAGGVYALRIMPCKFQAVAEKDGLAARADGEVVACISPNIDDSGSYWDDVRPKVGNLYDADFLLSAEVSPDPPVDPGTPVDPYTPVPPSEKMPYETAATVYDGYLYDSKRVVGSVQVKVARGKTVRQTGVFSAKVTATVQLVGMTKKLSFKNGVADKTGSVTLMEDKENRRLEISLGADGLSGKLDGTYGIAGARNVFVGKSAADKSAADTAMKCYQRSCNLALGGDGGTLSIAVGKKGKTKIAGSIAGIKVNATGQLVVFGDTAAVPVVIAKKNGPSVSFCFWLNANGVVGQQGSTMEIIDVGSKGALGIGSRFRLDPVAVEKLKRWLVGLYSDYLPNGISVSQNGKKWIVADGAKEGKLVLDKTTGSLDLKKSKFTDNMAGLKFTYKEKDGTFRGSFKVCNLESGKIKSYSANVTGVMIGEKGYGTATVKKVGTVSVTIK